MLLSVVIYRHRLTPGQWLGATVVFAGISVEAYIKRKGKTCVFHINFIDLSPRSRCPRQTRATGEGESQD